MKLMSFIYLSNFTVKGQPEPAPGRRPNAKSERVTPEYFRTMGDALLKGCAFTDHNRKVAPQVVIIKETLAHQVFGSRDPIGERLNLGDSKKPDLWEIVGVVGDIHAFGLGEKV